MNQPNHSPSARNLVPTFEEIKEKAFELGWDDLAITEATVPQEDVEAYRKWIEEGRQADLGYMENAMRCDPQQLLPGARTAILFVSNYKQPSLPFQEDAGLIASYARGRKYHNVHYRRIKKFIKWLGSYVGKNGSDIAKGFSDSAPIMEKALAVKAGLGWFGKNTLLIHRKFGTYTLLSGVLTTLDLSYEPPRMEMRLPRCGSCTLCLDHCPTNALVAPYLIEAERCLSYQLIESKEELPEKTRKDNPGYVFGCDICQEVCPHNKRSPLSESLDFHPDQGVGPYLTEQKLKLLEEEPEELFGTPLQRQGVGRLRKNLESVLSREQ